MARDLVVAVGDVKPGRSRGSVHLPWLGLEVVARAGRTAHAAHIAARLALRLT